MLGRRDPQGDLFRADNVLRGYVGEDSFYGLLAQHAAGWFSDDSFGAEEQGLRHGVRRYAAQCLARCVDAILKVFRGRLSRCDYTPRHEAGHRRNVRIIPNTAEFPASIDMRLQPRCTVNRFLEVLQLPLVYLVPRRPFAFLGLFELLDELTCHRRHLCVHVGRIGIRSVRGSYSTMPGSRFVVMKQNVGNVDLRGPGEAQCVGECGRLAERNDVQVTWPTWPQGTRRRHRRKSGVFRNPGGKSGSPGDTDGVEIKAAEMKVDGVAESFAVAEPAR